MCVCIASHTSPISVTRCGTSRHLTSPRPHRYRRPALSLIIQTTTTVTTNGDGAFALEKCASPICSSATRIPGPPTTSDRVEKSNRREYIVSSPSYVFFFPSRIYRHAPATEQAKMKPFEWQSPSRPTRGECLTRARRHGNWSTAV